MCGSSTNRNVECKNSENKQPRKGPFTLCFLLFNRLKRNETYIFPHFFSLSLPTQDLHHALHHHAKMAVNAYRNQKANHIASKYSCNSFNLYICRQNDSLYSIKSSPQLPYVNFDITYIFMQIFFCNCKLPLMLENLNLCMF